MTYIDEFIFNLEINEKPLLISAKDIIKLNFSYGMLSTVPFFEIRFVDKAYITTTVLGSYPIKLSFGPTPEELFVNDYTIMSDLEMDTGAFGGNTTGFGGFKCYLQSLASMIVQDEISKAFEIPQGSSLKLVYDQCNISIDGNASLKPTNRDIFVYKGVENCINFLSALALYTTDVSNNLAYAVYFDKYGTGKLVSFLNKLKDFKPLDCETDNMLSSDINTYPVMDVALNNTIRENLLEDGIYSKVWGGNFITEESQVSGSIDWLNSAPMVKSHLSDILEKGEPYPIESVPLGFLSDIEEQYIDTYAANIAYWNKVRSNISAVTIPSMVQSDLEPGSLFRVYNSSAGPNGIYVILQKSFILSRESGLYTKLWIFNIKVY